MPADCVSVTRPGILGNPFTGTDAIRQFREYAAAMLDRSIPDWKIAARYGAKAARRRAMFRVGIYNVARNRYSVACFCELEKPCHGDVILEIAERLR